jgi:hypothetical protein
VSVLPAVSKILERLMYNRMITYIDKFSLLTKWQFGFRPRRSTQDAIANFVDYVTNLDKKNDVCALFINVAKAFDSLNHEIFCINYLLLVSVVLVIHGSLVICVHVCNMWRLMGISLLCVC